MLGILVGVALIALIAAIWFLPVARCPECRAWWTQSRTKTGVVRGTYRCKECDHERRIILR